MTEEHVRMLREICDNAHKFNKPPAFLKYTSDWLGSATVAAMTTEQAGAYDFLLCNCWENPELALPNDDEKLARMSRLHDHWPVCGQDVKACFVPHPILGDAWLTNIRLVEVRHKQMSQAVNVHRRWHGTDTEPIPNGYQLDSDARDSQSLRLLDSQGLKSQVSKRERPQPSADGLSLAKHLRDRIAQNHPTAAVSKLSGSHMESKLNAWGCEIDKVMRVDKRAPDEIRSVINFAHDDNVPGPSKNGRKGFCWAAVTLSPSNLRNDNLWTQFAATGSAPRKETEGERCEREAEITRQLDAMRGR